MNPKLFIVVGILASMAAIAFIESQYAVSVTRATALLLVGLSVPIYLGYRLTSNPWLKRIAIALLPTAIIMWLVNSDLTAYPLG